MQRLFSVPSTGAAISSNNFTVGCTVELRQNADHVALGLSMKCRGRIRAVLTRGYTIEWTCVSGVVKVVDVIGKHICVVLE